MSYFYEPTDQVTPIHTAEGGRAGGVVDQILSARAIYGLDSLLEDPFMVERWRECENSAIFIRWFASTDPVHLARELLRRWASDGECDLIPPATPLSDPLAAELAEWIRKQRAGAGLAKRHLVKIRYVVEVEVEVSAVDSDHASERGLYLGWDLDDIVTVSDGEVVSVREQTGG